MSLEIRKTSKWWYGRWMKDGKRHCACLDVEIVGQPGEDAFVDSRRKAQDALDKLITGWREQKRPEDLVQEIHRVKFGHKIGSISLTHLFEAWRNIPRKHQPKERYLQWVAVVFKRLSDFIHVEFPRVKELSGVDRKIVEAFMRHEASRKMSPRTYNAELVLLRGAFEHLREDAGMLNNPFRKMVTRDAETIHRKPFTQEELSAILNAAREDALMYPLVIIGSCTAMRRGDCCQLKWSDVDMKNRYVRVKTSKTGEGVEIPMFGILYDLLSTLAKGEGKSPYVLPELVAMYQNNPSGVNWRLNSVFKNAGFMDAEELKLRQQQAPGKAIVHRGEVHMDGDNRGRAGCLRGFHSFRVTWITIALAAGVPMELVTRVTGHQSVDVVLKHYFKPGREDFRRAIEGAMPKLLMSGSGQEEKTPKEKILEICAGVKAKTWKQDVKRIAELAASL